MSKLLPNINKVNVRSYREDGIVTLRNKNEKEIDKIGKKIKKM